MSENIENASLQPKSECELDHPSFIGCVGDLPKGIGSNAVVHLVELGLIQEVDEFGSKLKLWLAPTPLGEVEILLQGDVPIVRAVDAKGVIAKVSPSPCRKVGIEVFWAEDGGRGIRVIHAFP